MPLLLGLDIWIVMYVEICVEERALVLSMIANMMGFVVNVAAAERVSWFVGLVPKLSQGPKFDLDVVITPAPAHRTRVETTIRISMWEPVYSTYP